MFKETSHARHDLKTLRADVPLTRFYVWRAHITQPPQGCRRTCARREYSVMRIIPQVIFDAIMSATMQLRRVNIYQIRRMLPANPCMCICHIRGKHAQPEVVVDWTERLCVCTSARLSSFGTGCTSQDAHLNRTFPCNPARRGLSAKDANYIRGDFLGPDGGT